MRKIELDGYIDETEWSEDDITPGRIRALLNGEDGKLTDDVEIVLNSYGGSVNAATKIYDAIKAYPGKVEITISGTAASAAVGMVMAADKLRITPGSMMMIHDPSCMACGNRRDLEEAIRMLDTAKDSILNVYETRVRTKREELSDLMSAETWMDSREALERGFVDEIVTEARNEARERPFDREKAMEKVNAFYDRKTEDKAHRTRDKPEETPEEATGAQVSARERRLKLMKMNWEG